MQISKAKKIWLVMTEDEASALLYPLAGTAAVSALVMALAIPVVALVAAAVMVAALIGLALIVKTGLGHLEQVLKNKGIEAWLKEARDEDEVHARMGMLQSMGASALTASSTSMALPAFNVDGTPMVGIVDVKGHVYGQTDSMASRSDEGTSLSTTGGYQPPIGLDHTPGGGFGGSNGMY